MSFCPSLLFLSQEFRCLLSVAGIPWPASLWQFSVCVLHFSPPAPKLSAVPAGFPFLSEGVPPRVTERFSAPILLPWPVLFSHSAVRRASRRVRCASRSPVRAARLVPSPSRPRDRVGSGPNSRLGGNWSTSTLSSYSVFIPRCTFVFFYQMPSTSLQKTQRTFFGTDCVLGGRKHETAAVL